MFTCPNCRGEIVMDDFIDMRDQDQQARNLAEENALRTVDGHLKHFVANRSGKTQKTDFYYLLDIEGELNRRVFYASHPERKFALSQGGV